VVLKPKGEGADDVFALAAPPEPAPPNIEGLGASPLGLLRPLPPNNEGDAPAVAAPPPKRPPGLLAAGVLDAPLPPPPKRLDVPVLDPPPKRPLPPVLAPEFALLLAVPNMDGVDPPEVLLVAPKRGLFAGVLLLLCWPKVKPDMLGGCWG
jgi:hypothetical protein